MAPWPRALAAFIDDPDLSPTPTGGSQVSVTLVSRDLMSSFSYFTCVV